MCCPTLGKNTGLATGETVCFDKSYMKHHSTVGNMPYLQAAEYLIYNGRYCCGGIPTDQILSFDAH